MKFLKTAIAVLLMLTMISATVAYAAPQYEIELVSPPRRTVFYEGKDWGYFGNEILPYADFDLAGTAISLNGTVVQYYVFPWGGNMWAEPASGVWKAGTNAVRIYLDSDYDDTYVSATLTLVKISSIEVTEYPNTVLIRGVHWHYDSLGYIAAALPDLTGLALTVHYSDGTSETLQYGKATKGLITCSVPASTNNLVLGKNTFHINYCSQYTNIEFDFQKESITRASVSETPTKVVYDYAADWHFDGSAIVPSVDLHGLSVTAVYNNGTKETVAYDAAPERFSVKSGQRFFCGSNICTVLLDGAFGFNIYFDILRYGDINVDGEVNSSDALLALRHSVSSVTLSGSQFQYADVDADGTVNSSDALAIINFSVGLTSSFLAERA